MSLLRLVGLEEDCGRLCSLDGRGGTESEDGIEGSMVATCGFLELRALQTDMEAS